MAMALGSLLGGLEFPKAKMSIIEVIEKAGLENVRVQSVASDLFEMKRNKNGATLTIATSHEMASAIAKESAGIPSTHFGLLVWIPREQVASPNVRDEPRRP